VQTNILDAKPDATLSVYAIFFEMVAGDEGAKYAVEPGELIADPRVTVYWDERQLAGRFFDENVTRLGRRNGEEDRVEWDAFVLYGHSSAWSDDKPPPYLIWGRPLLEERSRLLQGLEEALARVPP